MYPFYVGLVGGKMSSIDNNSFLTVEFDDCVPNAPDLRGCNIHTKTKGCSGGRETIVECYEGM